MTRLVAATVVAGFLAAAPAYAGGVEGQHVERVVKTWRIGSYVVKHVGVYERESGDIVGEERLLVSLSGKILQTFEDGRIDIEHWMEAPKGLPFPPVGTNVTGGRHPQVIVQGYSGGAHCCVSMAVLDLGPTLQVYGVPGGGDWPVYLRAIEPGKALNAVTHDQKYTFWKTGYAESPAPELVFRFQDDEYVMAADLMRRPAPNRQDLERLAAQVRGHEDWGRAKDFEVPSDMWRIAIELVYSGNFAAAEQFFDMAWNPVVAGKDEAARELFRCRIRKSGVWPDIAAMNGRAADPPEGECPGLEEG